MALAKDLEIYKAADQLLALSLRLQVQVPRAYRQAVGQRISNECADILLTVARANAARGESREAHIADLLERLEAATRRLRQMPAAEVFAAGNSYLGLVGQATHHHRDRATLAKVLMARGHAVKGDFSKVYRRKE